MPYDFNPLVPRPIDRPTAVPLPPLSDGQLLALDEAKVFAGPEIPADRQAWRDSLERWRQDAHRRLNYQGKLYDLPEGQWASTCYSVAQVWLWDELLYSFDEARFTPERLMEDAQSRFGGFDGVVLWHAYPIIGIDDRNQWDYYREVPGLKNLVDWFHDHGVRVFFDYNPWDVGTRRSGEDLDELCALVEDFQVDGLFLDTLKQADVGFADRLREVNPGILLEGESKLPVERIEDHGASWAQFYADSPVPGVLRSHWFERRHMQHHVRRWHRDHTEELQSAWLNGVGMMIWEVVFGVWVGWSKRDATTVKQMTTVQRAAGDLWTNTQWEPLTELTEAAEEHGVYASKWSADGIHVWTLVNRSDSPFAHDARDALPQWVRDADPSRVVALIGADGIPAQGIACVVVADPQVAWPAWVDQARESLADIEKSEDAAFQHRIARRLPVSADNVEAVGRPAVDTVSPSVRVRAGEHVLTVRYRARETGMYQGAPYVDEWKPLPPRLHDARTLQREVDLDHDVLVAPLEVTNAQFAQFVRDSGYTPRQPNRFWVDRVEDDLPATYVDLEDARAYCAWVGGRLPTEDEWQIAANDPGFDRALPQVWNWTESEHSDGRTRFVMLKGGAEYRADGSDWYVEGGVLPAEFSLKYLYPGGGLARSSSIGFRVAWDVEDEDLG